MHKFQKKKGSALFIAIIFSLIGLIVLAGLYYAYYRSLMVIFPIRTYSDIREGVIGTVNLIATYVDKRYFSKIDQQDCPPGTENLPNATAIRCCKAEIKIRLIGYNELFPVHSEVCLMGFSFYSVGYSAQPAGQGIKVDCDNYPCIYAIKAEGRGPQGISAFLETLYEFPSSPK
ncbi:MAG: hypothetical protein ABWJ99_03045 [Caldimicrobium sp.]